MGLCPLIYPPRAREFPRDQRVFTLTTRAGEAAGLVGWQIQVWAAPVEQPEHHADAGVVQGPLLPGSGGCQGVRSVRRGDVCSGPGVCFGRMEDGKGVGSACTCEAGEAFGLVWPVATYWVSGQQDCRL